MAVIAKAGNKIIIGLEERNIEKLRAGQPFHKYGAEIGAPMDVAIFYGRTEADLHAAIRDLIGPETEIIDTRDKRKN